MKNKKGKKGSKDLKGSEAYKSSKSQTKKEKSMKTKESKNVNYKDQTCQWEKGKEKFHVIGEDGNALCGETNLAGKEWKEAESVRKFQEACRKCRIALKGASKPKKETKKEKKGKKGKKDTTATEDKGIRASYKGQICKWEKGKMFFHVVQDVKDKTAICGVDVIASKKKSWTEDGSVRDYEEACPGCIAKIKEAKKERKEAKKNGKGKKASQKTKGDKKSTGKAGKSTFGEVITKVMDKLRAQRDAIHGKIDALQEKANGISDKMNYIRATEAKFIKEIKSKGKK